MIEASVKIATAEMNNFRVPKRSASQPLYGNADGQRQDVTGDDGFEAERVTVETARHGRHGRVHDGRVERFHEQHDADQPR